MAFGSRNCLYNFQVRNNLFIRVRACEKILREDTELIMSEYCLSIKNQSVGRLLKVT